MSNLADQLKKQSQNRTSENRQRTPDPAAGADRAPAPGPPTKPPSSTSADGYRPNVKKLSAELPADEFKWVRVTAAQNDTNATAIVRGLLLLARKDPKILNAALDQLR